MVKISANRFATYIACCLFFVQSVCNVEAKTDKQNENNYKIVKIDVDTMPSLNVPRAGAAIFMADNEIVAMGGHTTGFLPLNNAEYFANGKWNIIQMTYEHDNPLFCTMKSGKVLIAGGSEKHLGIGQTFPAEIYDPINHSFSGFGCLEHKRSLATATEIDDGKVVIAGNWYDDDMIECFDGKSQFKFVKNCQTHKACPYILKCAKDDVIIFSKTDNKGNIINSTIVESLKGDAFDVPLLHNWHVNTPICIFQSLTSFIGDDENGIYEYLITAVNDSGQVAVIKTHGKEFSILKTAADIPMTSPYNTQIDYYSYVIADRFRKRAYIMGNDEQKHLYVLRIDYDDNNDGRGAPMTLYHTEPLPFRCYEMPVLKNDGNLVIVGGIPGTNFEPLDNVLLLNLTGKQELYESAKIPLWILYGAIAIIAIAIIAAIMACRKKRKARTQHNYIKEKQSKNTESENPNLMDRIAYVMNEKKPYLNSDLKVGDIAEMIGVPARNISECIRQKQNATFSQFINRFRVEHAKQLLANNQTMKISAVCMESGFSNETSFFRTFKHFTGMTPGEWQSSILSN